MRSVVVGGAGFIGSHLVDALLARGDQVTAIDNLSSGNRAFLPTQHPELRFLRSDVTRLTPHELAYVFSGHDIVFHLSANPEARAGLLDHFLDHQQGTTATLNVLEATHIASVPRFFLASSGTVYGDTARLCDEMDLGVLPISLYGASKLASEALVSAFAHCFGLRTTICRFGNVVGARATHGAIFDFCKKLETDHERLLVLGDGNQAKPYLHVTDCVRGILHAVNTNALVMNLAPNDTTTVAEIAARVVAESPYPKAEIVYGQGAQGWKGDVPISRLDASAAEWTGFVMQHESSLSAVNRAVAEIVEETWGHEAIHAARVA